MGNKILNEATNGNVINRLLNKLNVRIFAKNFNKKKLETIFLEEHNLFDVGTGHVFVLRSPDITYCSRIINKKEHVLFFVNKLVALIYALIEKENTGIDYEIINFTRTHQVEKNLLKLSYDKKNLDILVVFGFFGIQTASGIKWANNGGESFPAVMAFKYTMNEIESGFDLNNYFFELENNNEREETLFALVKTNHTPISNLTNIATKVLEDMRKNTVETKFNDDSVYHRMIFSAE